jgi:septal ring factor EnvC (AmiA/AmiB activator)
VVDKLDRIERGQQKLANSVSTTLEEVTDIRTTQADMERVLCSVEEVQIDLAIGMEDMKSEQKDLARQVEKIQITQEKDPKKINRSDEKLEKIYRDTGEMKEMLSDALNRQPVSGTEEEPPTSSYQGTVSVLSV